MVLEFSMAMAMAPSRLLPVDWASSSVQGLTLPVASLHNARFKGASIRRHNSASVGVRAMSSNQWMAGLTSSDNETSREPFSVLASMLVVGACTAVFGCCTPYLAAAHAAEGVTEEPSILFQRTCAGCHAGGGNILQPNSTLFAKDLDRNGMANVENIFQITYSGKGRMPVSHYYTTTMKRNNQGREK